jgi:hypothetical protein
VKYVLLLGLVACGSRQTVVVWGGASNTPGEIERVEVGSDGESRYLTVADGVETASERVALSKDQVRELDEMIREKHACALVHDPAYTPSPNEIQITLDVRFPDQHCTVTLYELEWLRGAAREIAETMRSMRPIRKPGVKPQNRRLNPRM